MTLDLSRYDLGELAPEQIAAFWRLGHVTANDIPRFAMHWLEHGAESDAVAVLAGETDPTIREHGRLFERALLDIGAIQPGSRERDFWILTRFLLQRIAAEGREPFPEAGNLIVDVHWNTQDLQLFLRSDLPPPHARNPRGTRYAGEEMGIEALVGAIFSLDDIDDFDRQSSDVAHIMQLIKEQAASVLDRFYTSMPERFPAAPF